MIFVGTSVNKSRHHGVSFQSLPGILGGTGKNFAEYFNLCRIKKNTSDYTSCGEVSDGEV